MVRLRSIESLLKKLAFALYFGTAALVVVTNASAANLQWSDCDLLLQGSEASILKVISSDGMTVGEARAAFEMAQSDFAQELKLLESSLNSNSSARINILETLETLRENYERRVYPILFVARMSPDENLRQAFQEMIEKYTAPVDQIFLSSVFYRRIQQIRPTDEKQKKILEIYLKEFEDYGMGGSDPHIAARIKALSQKVQEKSSQFVQALSESPPIANFTAVDLAGLGSSELAHFEQNAEGFVFNGRNSNQLSMILTYAKNGSTRKKAYLLARGAATENIAKFREILRWRDQLAKLKLGPKATWLDLVIDQKSLAGSPQEVGRVLEAFANEFEVTSRGRLHRMRQLKELAEPEDSQFRPWDIHYYNRLAAEEMSKSILQPGVTIEGLSKFMPAAQTVNLSIQIVAEVLGLQVEEVSDFKGYADGTRLYVIKDKVTKKLLGRLLFDLTLRKGKNPSSAFAGYLARPSERELAPQAPFVDVVANLFKPEEMETAFLNFSQLRSLFHELGHAFHAILSKAPTYSLSGFSRTSDFMEIPSILFEQLLREPEVLSRIVTPVFGVKPSEKALKAAIDKYDLTMKSGFIRGSPFFSPTYQQNSIFLAILDHRLHKLSDSQIASTDLSRLFEQMFLDFHHFETDAADQFLAQFFHPQNGMPGTYYSYLWSPLYVQVIADWFAKNGGLTNPKAMAKYRKVILESNGIDDPKVLIEKLVGEAIDLEKVIQNILR